MNATIFNLSKLLVSTEINHIVLHLYWGVPVSSWASVVDRLLSSVPLCHKRRNSHDLLPTLIESGARRAISGIGFSIVDVECSLPRLGYVRFTADFFLHCCFSSALARCSDLCIRFSSSESKQLVLPGWNTWRMRSKSFDVSRWVTGLE